MTPLCCFEHLCERVTNRMGVPIKNTLLIFVVQILLISTAKGLPFASISLPSLKTADTSSSDKTSVSSIPKSDTIENLPSQGALSSKNCQLFIGTPDANPIFSSQTPLSNSANNALGVSTDTAKINLLTPINLQNTATEHNPTDSNSIDASNDKSYLTLSTGLSIAPILNIDYNSGNVKRDIRGTVSPTVKEPCQNSLSSSGYLSPFSSVPSLNNLQPIFPSVGCRLPVNFTESPGNSANVKCNSQDANKLTNTVTTNTQEKATVGITNTLNNRNVLSNYGNKLHFTQDTACSCESGEMTNVPLQSAANTLSSFAAIKNYVNSRQNVQSTLNSDNMQNQPCVMTNVSPGVNNNLMLAQAIQNNNVVSQQLSAQTMNNQENNIQASQNNVAVCENTMNQYNRLAAEYENVLRIRNSVIPKMLSNNDLVKNIPRNIEQNNNNNNLGCPQLKTVSVDSNVPFVNNNNNILTNPINNRGFSNNNINVGNGRVDLSFNNIARLVNDNLDENVSNCETQSNNNQGCPQLLSIPVYHKESLINRQLLLNSQSSNKMECPQNNLDITLSVPNDNVDFRNNNLITLNQNNQGSPQLLALAQKNLNAVKNNANINIVNNQNCLNELPETFTINSNCNYVQAPAPNDNLVQALKLKNLSKSNHASQAVESTINILPYGKALLDGKPISNNFIALDSVPNVQSTVTRESCNSNNFLSIQDVSVPITCPPVNQYNASPDVSVALPSNMITPSFSSVNTSPLVNNVSPPIIHLAPSVPITVTELPFLQNSFCNSNVLPMLTLADNNLLTSSNTLSAIPVISNSATVQPLSQLTFLSNVPSSTVPISDNCISSVSNLPTVCTSMQPLLSSPYVNQLIPATTQSNTVPDAAALFPSLNNAVSALTQNIISTIVSKTMPSTGIPLAQLPPVNPISSALITESITSPFCVDISQPLQCTAPLGIPRISLLDIPVACNEYLPPVYSIPITSFNSDLFCVKPDSYLETSVPFALSMTDVYYPEISFLPSVASSDCSSLCGPLFAPAKSLPQSSAVIKINNTGRDAKELEQLINCIIL